MEVENLTTVIKSSKKEVSICRDIGITIIGERINPTGRKALQAELKAGKFDIVRNDAAAQIKAGASIIDVNAGVPGIDEPHLLVQMIKEVQTAADDPPICIDTANVKALEEALKYYCKNGAKPLVNSVTAEMASIREVLPLVKRYGAAVIGLCSGDSGIPKNAVDRLQNAEKIIEEGSKVGIPAEDIIIDSLVLTLGVKWEAGKGILQATAKIAENFGINITMGASNISFGMPDREQLTSYFLSMAVVAGLSCPICNPLSKQEMIALKAAGLIMGRDPRGMEWIRAFRARQIV